MKKTKKIVLILMIAFLLVNVFNYNKVYAKQDQGTTGGGQFENTTHPTVDSNSSSDTTIINPSYFDPSKSEKNQDKDSEKFVEKVGVILGAIQAIGSILSVLALVVIGIKYMLGSAEEKANYKQTMIPYIIGIILVFASSTFVNAIYKAIH